METENKVVNLTNQPVLAADPFVEDVFTFRNGAEVIIRAPRGEELTLTKTIYLLERVKYEIMREV